mgnify:CR=1 FL=1
MWYPMISGVDNMMMDPTRLLAITLSDSLQKRDSLLHILPVVERGEAFDVLQDEHLRQFDLS